MYVCMYVCIWWTVLVVHNLYYYYLCSKTISGKTSTEKDKYHGLCVAIKSDM